MRSRFLLIVATAVVGGLAATSAPTAAIPLPYDEDPPLYVLQWGSGGDLDSQFSTPTGVATAPNGDVYVADRDNDRIQRFSDVGVYETQWGTPGSGNGQFRDPYGIAVDVAGNVYVSEVTNDRIQVFTADGDFQTSWGGPGNGQGQFNNPTAMAFAANGDLLVADTDNDRIQRFENDGTFVSTFGSQGTLLGQMNDPEGIAVHPSNGKVYVADTGNNRVQIFSSEGVAENAYGSTGTLPGRFNSPRGLALNDFGEILVADTANHRIQVLTSLNLTPLSSIGSSGSGNGQFNLPRAVALAKDDERIFVADTGSQRIQKLGPQVDFEDVSTSNVFYDDISWIAAGGYANGYTSPPPGSPPPSMPPPAEAVWYRPSQPLTRQAMSAFMYRLAGSPAGLFPDPGFADVSVTHPFYTTIAWLATTGITNGYDNNTFRPAGTITRQAMAAFMYRYRASPSGTFPNPGFSDVRSNNVFFKEISWAADAGVVDGYVDGTFRPSNPVTRQAMASFLFGLSELGVPVI